MLLAPPSTPLGMLQRGRGAGALWALSAPREEARTALLRCLLEDPRRDPQLSDFAGYWTDLAEALDLDLAPLAARLEGPGRDPDPRRAEGAVDLVAGVLGRLSSRGGPKSAAARGLLLDYLERGTAWAQVLADWVLSDPPAGILDGAADRISARFPAEADLARAMDNPFLWPQWFSEGPLLHPRLAAAAALPRSARFHSLPPEPPLPSDPSLLPLSSLLLSCAQFHRPELPAPLAEELGRRGSPEELEALRAAARRDPDPRVRARAVEALAARGEDVLEAIDAILGMDLRAFHCVPLRPRLLRLLEAHLFPSSLPFARTWAGGGDFFRRRMAESILESFAEPRDLPLIESRVAEAADGMDPEAPCPCWALEVLARLAGEGARPLLERVFEGTNCALARGRAAELLAGLRGGLGAGRSFESLWDAEPEVVLLGIGQVALRRPGAPERLRALAAGGGGEVGPAAAARLAAGTPGGSGESIT